VRCKSGPVPLNTITKDINKIWCMRFESSLRFYCLGKDATTHGTLCGSRRTLKSVTTGSAGFAHKSLEEVFRWCERGQRLASRTSSGSSLWAQASSAGQGKRAQACVAHAIYTPSGYRSAFGFQRFCGRTARVDRQRRVKQTALVERPVASES
jgi:hypothetical protein